jgi:hypothetical protein
MRFSNKAYKYLNKLSRDKNLTVSDKQDVIDYLKNQSILPFDKIVEFQTDFSGLELTITNKPKSTFQASLFSKEDILQNNPINTVEVEGKLYFYCGDHTTAQFPFVIGENGQICTYNQKDKTVNIISSSFDKFIETYAFKDLIGQNKKYEHPFCYDLNNHSSFEELSKRFFRHDKSSDEYSQWFSDGKLIILKGTWYDRPDFYIHIYGEDGEQCESFLQHLKDNLIIT